MTSPVSVRGSGLRHGLLALVVALAPALAAIWLVPGFATQDGPAHLYNAHILARSFDPASPFRNIYSVCWEPLPNWVGHFLLMGLVSIFAPATADRAMTTLTLVGLAASTLLLRWRVAGERGLALAAVLCVLVAMNVTWLLGFSSFLLGACLFPLTLSVWWSGRDSGDSPGRALALAGLMILGYFCHLVSLGLTAIGLVVLEATTPGPFRRGRARATVLGLTPLIPLALIYLGLMQRGGRLAPEWKHLPRLDTVRAWISQLGWVDPLTLARRDMLPLRPDLVSRWFMLVTPIVCFTVGLALAVAVRMRARRLSPNAPSRGWWALAALLLGVGAISPDTLGASHGEYLPQRIVLLGLVALIPVLQLDAPGRVGRLVALAFGLAWVGQSGFVWDYALTSRRMTESLPRAREILGQRQRIATRLTNIRTHFRASPLLHADCILGVGTGNVIWSNYETRYYYFPVRFREPLDRPDPSTLERIALDDHPATIGDRAAGWQTLLDRHRGSIDVVLAWGDDPALDAITERWFQTTYVDGPLRVFRRRPDAAEARETPPTSHEERLTR